MPNPVTDHDIIVQYNRENGTNFYNIKQVNEDKLKKAEAHKVWANDDETVGSSRFRATIAAAHNAPTQKQAAKIALDAAKQRGVETLTAFSIPMLGTELVTYGPLVGTARLAVGSGTATVGSNVLGKAGDYIDKKAGTNFVGNIGRIVGGFGGYGLGIGATNPLLRTAAGKGVTLHMPQETFMNLRGQYFDNAAKHALNGTISKVNPTLTSTINHLYKEHPELSSIGPKEAYRQYYETIFPASKVQTPYAHGTKSDLTGGLEASVKIPNAAAPETMGRNDFYLNLQPEASLQYADGIGVPKGFTWNKHRFWPLKEILGKPYKSDAWMSKPIKLREQVPNRAGQFSRVKNADGTYSGHGKLLEEYKAELGMQDLSNEEFLQRLGVQNEESFNQWVAKNKQMFSDIYDSGDYHGLYHVKIDASKPLTIKGGNTYYSERGIWDRMDKGGNDVLLHNNATNEFGSDVAVVRDVTPQKVRILGSDPDKQAFANFMNGHNISFTPTPQKPVSTVHFDPRVKPLSRPSLSRIAIDTDERFLSGQNLLYSLDGTNIGPTIDAHGISKGLTSQQLDQLEQILNSGISKNIYTAPLARIDGVGSALGTSSGTAYTDGMFIVAGKPGKSLHDGIDTILINSADENYAQALKTYYSKKYPNFNFITYNEAPAHYGVEKKIIPEVKVTTTPTKTNAINKLDVNELPPPPEEVNFVLKQGGILKAQSGTFEDFWNTLPQNQQDSTDFNVHRYWELNGKPSNFKEAVKRGMYKKEKNGYHANSVAFNKETGEYEFMKSPNHPTIKYELDWFNSDKAKKFRNKYQLDSTSIPWKYIPKEKQGGIIKGQNGIPEINGGELQPVIVKPAPVKIVLRTDPITKHTPITHSSLRAPDFFVSKGSDDPAYNFLKANCSDATGEVLELFTGQDFTSGITTPIGVSRKVRKIYGSKPGYSERKMTSRYQEFEVPWYDYRRAKDLINYNTLQTILNKYNPKPNVKANIIANWAKERPTLPYYLDEDNNVHYYKE